jgi:hypothetical protein
VKGIEVYLNKETGPLQRTDTFNYKNAKIGWDIKDTFLKNHSARKDQIFMRATYSGLFKSLSMSGVGCLGATKAGTILYWKT